MFKKHLNIFFIALKIFKCDKINYNHPSDYTSLLFSEPFYVYYNHIISYPLPMKLSKDKFQ